MATRTLTDDERAERRERERELVQHAVEQLRCSEGWQAWLAARRHFYRYSLHNQLLIALQRVAAHCLLGAGRDGHSVQRAPETHGGLR